MRDIFRQIVVVLATVGVIAINGLASAQGLNGVTTGEISDRFDVYFVPAGYVFAIWGLIYLGLLGYTIFQALPAQRENPRLRRIGWLYVLSCIANIVWLFLWHYEIFEWTIVAMVALLLSLSAIYLTLGIGYSRVSAGETWLARVPFGIYLGWITVATIANATALLFYLDWGGWGISPEWWAIIMLVIGAIIGFAVGVTRGDIAYVAVIVWAFAGIAVKLGMTSTIAIVAWVAAGFVALSLLLGVPHTQGRLREQEVNPPAEGVRDRW